MSRISVSRVLSALIVLGATGATAAPSNTAVLVTPSPSEIPPQCVPLTRTPAATIPGPVISAHISVANCMAEAAMNALRLAPDAASIDQANAAVAPSARVLDSVIRLDDPYWSLVAADAKRDLYDGLIVRERATTGGDLAVQQALEPLLTAWSREADRASAEVAAITNTYPDLRKRDPVIAAVIARNDLSRSGAQTARR